MVPLRIYSLTHSLTLQKNRQTGIKSYRAISTSQSAAVLYSVRCCAAMVTSVFSLICLMITHAGMGRTFSSVRSQACLSVCLFIHALTGKRLELPTPNLVHVYSIAVARHALTQRSKGHSHTVTKTVTAHGC